MTNQQKDIILFVNAIRPATLAALKDLEKQVGHELKSVVIVDKKIKTAIDKNTGQNNLPVAVPIINVDFDSVESIRDALKPYAGKIFAVTAQFENCIFELRRLVPHLPYLSMPTEESLVWSTEKEHMRRLIRAYAPELGPKFIKVAKYSEEMVQKIEDSMSYPIMVKPSGLEGSFLVSMVNNSAELRETLAYTFQEMQSGYDREVKRQKPFILVEEFMAGDMYSIDTYVAADGSCMHTPPVKVLTGRKVGFDDFFGYLRLAPSGLSHHEISQANQAAEKACRAVGLRSITAHVELMHTPKGWKIIELGPRIGGHRHEIYQHAYGINHIANDILNRAGHTPKIPSKPVEHSAFFIIYARQEGILDSISGIEEIKNLPSFISIEQMLQKGQPLYFAKNNGEWVLEVMLSHKDQSQLMHDISVLEKKLIINVRPFQLINRGETAKLIVK